jgi:hypothetical protein
LALKLSGVPSRSLAIWWHTVQAIPSLAIRRSSADAVPPGRYANTPPFPPAASEGFCVIGMWQAAHSAWISSVCVG